jgi:hypothetical protein
MTVSFPFQQQHTWRKLGYLYFTDSLDYRTVLEENPQWKVTELPPVGAQIRITPTSQTNGAQTGLTQGAFIFTGTTAGQGDSIFPYNSQNEYDDALARYTHSAYENRETLNGITFDSKQAITGVQNG